MPNAVRLWHGAKMYVSPADPADATDAEDYNAAAFTAGAAAYKEVGSPLNIGGEWGVMRKTAESEPLDRTSTRIAIHDITDYGSIEIEYERDDNDPGQEAFDTADSDTGLWTLKIVFEFENAGSNGFRLPRDHDEDDKAIYLRGYVMSNTNPGGATGDFIKRKVVMRLTAEPVTVG